MGVRAPKPLPLRPSPAGMDRTCPHLKMKMKSISSMQKGGHVVHGLHEHHELPLQRQQAHQLQHPHQAEGPQHRQAAPCWPTISHTLQGAGVGRGPEPEPEASACSPSPNPTHWERRST